MLQIKEMVPIFPSVLTLESLPYKYHKNRVDEVVASTVCSKRSFTVTGAELR